MSAAIACDGTVMIRIHRNARDTNLKITGSLLDVIPGKGSGKVDLKLMMQRLRIMIVSQNKRFVFFRSLESIKDDRMSLKRDDLRYVQNFTHKYVSSWLTEIDRSLIQSNEWRRERHTIFYFRFY